MTMSRSHRIVVFLGPSLPADEAGTILDAEYRPPASQGDVYRVLAAGVDTIVLLDGAFHSTPSVWQRELLDALEDGITVVGGASMGAIRAAELEPFGMQGSGTVFRWYRDGVIDGDDEVALRHADADHGFRALSEPLVNIRATLAAAVSDGCLGAEAAAALVEQAKATYYPDRCYQQLLAGPLARGWPIAVRSRLTRFLRHQAIDLKRADATETLRGVAEMSAAGGDRAAWRRHLDLGQEPGGGLPLRSVSAPSGRCPVRDTAPGQDGSGSHGRIAPRCDRALLCFRVGPLATDSRSRGRAQPRLHAPHPPR